MTSVTLLAQPTCRTGSSPAPLWYLFLLALQPSCVSSADLVVQAGQHVAAPRPKQSGFNVLRLVRLHSIKFWGGNSEPRPMTPMQMGCSWYVSHVTHVQHLYDRRPGGPTPGMPNIPGMQGMQMPMPQMPMLTPQQMQQMSAEQPRALC